MHQLTLHYSVSNGGDGSAYPHFSLSKELADIHQEIQSEFQEGWGESCTGQITLMSESPIFIDQQDFKQLITKESLIESLGYYLDGGYYKREHVKNLAQDFVDKINAIND